MEYLGHILKKSSMNWMEIFSWCLVGFGLFGTWVTGKHNIGWILAILFQVGWTYYALSIEAPALAVQSVAFGLIAARNYIVGRNRP